MATKISNLNEIKIANFDEYGKVEVPCIIQQKSSGSNDETKWSNCKVSLKDLKDNLDVRISENSTDILNLESTLSDYSDLKDSIKANSTDILNLESTLSDYSDLKDSIEANKNKIGNLEDALENTNSNIATLEEAIKDTKSDIEALSVRIDNLEPGSGGSSDPSYNPALEDSEIKRIANLEKFTGIPDSKGEFIKEINKINEENDYWNFVSRLHENKIGLTEEEKTKYIHAIRDIFAEVLKRECIEPEKASACIETIKTALNDIKSIFKDDAVPSDIIEIKTKIESIENALTTENINSLIFDINNIAETLDEFISYYNTFSTLYESYDNVASKYVSISEGETEPDIISETDLESINNSLTNIKNLLVSDDNILKFISGYDDTPFLPNGEITTINDINDLKSIDEELKTFENNLSNKISTSDLSLVNETKIFRENAIILDVLFGTLPGESESRFDYNVSILITFEDAINLLEETDDLDDFKKYYFVDHKDFFDNAEKYLSEDFGESLDERITSLELLNLESLNERVKTLENSSTEIDTEIAALKSIDTKNQADILKNSNDIIDNKNNINIVQSQVSSLREEFDMLEVPKYISCFPDYFNANTIVATEEPDENGMYSFVADSTGLVHISGADIICNILEANEQFNTFFNNISGHISLHLETGQTLKTNQQSVLFVPYK